MHLSFPSFMSIVALSQITTPSGWHHSLAKRESGSTMKGFKGRILKQLKSIPQVYYLNYHDRNLHSEQSLSPSPHSPNPSRIHLGIPAACGVESGQSAPRSPPQAIIDDAELMRDLEEEDESRRSDKENSSPPPRRATSSGVAKKRQSQSNEKSEFDPDAPSYRLPDLDSVTLFDPELLAAFQKAVAEHMQRFEEAKSRARAREEEGDSPPTKISRTDDAELDPLMEFEYRCPPGGNASVVLYSTTLRGIRKTFEDCNGVRFLLQTLKVKFLERDISMHLEFREELWRVLEARAIPPRLFIRGRYVGGADEVLGLHEQGRLLTLLRGVPLDLARGEGCEGCAGVRFVVCWECSGSRKVHGEDELGPIRCQRCNENGLVVCPVCC